MQRNFTKHVQTSWKTLQMKPGEADVEETHGGDEWSRKAVWVREGVAFKASLWSNAGCSLAVKTEKILSSLSVHGSCCIVVINPGLKLLQPQASEDLPGPNVLVCFPAAVDDVFKAPWLGKWIKHWAALKSVIAAPKNYKYVHLKICVWVK